MLRINQIIKILNSMKAYVPYAYKSKTDKIIKKMRVKLISIGFVFLFFIFFIITLYNHVSFLRTNITMYIIFILFFLGTIAVVVGSMLPVFLDVWNLKNWKKDSLNELMCEVYHDEENAKLLLDYSENELSYAIYCLQIIANRINTKITYFFGEKTAVLSILGLYYSAVQSSIGFDKLSYIFTGEVFTLEIKTMDIIILFGLIILLLVSINAFVLKKVTNHQKYLKEIVELAIRYQRDIQNDKGASA